MVPDVGPLLDKLRAGDETALAELVAALYDELRSVAARHLRSERPSHTLQATALVHEAYLKLMSDRQRGFADRAHFLAVASRVMRQVLVDYARSRATKKRSIGWTPGADDGDAKGGMDLAELLDLDTALDALESEDQPLARLVEMRYFGGMTAEETAEALGHSVHAVRHNLRIAQAWLRRNLSSQSR